MKSKILIIILIIVLIILGSLCIIDHIRMKNNEYVFKGIKLWNMPVLIIDNEVQTMWQKTVDVIKSGNIIKSINNGIRETNFPSSTQNKVCHVRPHARDAQDTYPLPVADKLTGATEYTKHCFWFNRGYLEEILAEYIDK